MPESASGLKQTNIEVKKTKQLYRAGMPLCASGLASCSQFCRRDSPGGGFLHGARAQEEYLARSSGLYGCLVNNPMYSFHRERHDPLYTDYVIYSPQVSVFRADEGNLLEEPYKLAIITSPAVNANHVQPERPSHILP